MSRCCAPTRPRVCAKTQSVHHSPEWARDVSEDGAVLRRCARLRQNVCDINGGTGRFIGGACDAKKVWAAPPDGCATLLRWALCPWKCTAVHRDVCDAPRLHGALPECMCESLFVCARGPVPAEKNCDHHSIQRLELCNETV